MARLQSGEKYTASIKKTNGKNKQGRKGKTSETDDVLAKIEQSVNIELQESGESEERENRRSGIEEILFKLPVIANPLIGTPKQVQKELDNMAKQIQRSEDDEFNDYVFNRIHLYMHGYLINVVLKQFPYIKGYQTVDIYQETLIALRFKAIPHFKKNKGMSFLNFAKMCIRRHLITLLNTSKNKQKDQAINQAVSLDSSPYRDDESGNTLANIIPDKGVPVDKMAENSESYLVTKNSLLSMLSEFEKVVLEEYLTGSAYKEIARNVSKRMGKRCKTKSIDNALLRIRKKAIYLQEHSRQDDLPLFII